MAKTLDVYLWNHLVGYLIQDDQGRMGFEYAQAWLEHTGAIPLSHSLPLKKEHFARKACRGFFAGILPEENKRKIIAHNLGISAQNDFSMLERIGGECAGAVTFLPTGVPLLAHQNLYRTLTDPALADILKALPRRPLLAGDEGVRLSLAGAQDKIAVHIAGDRVSLPLGNTPSTHILKPALADFEGVVFNEALCMKLAAAMGLSVAPVDSRRVMDIDYLLVARYDRKAVSANSRDNRRLHQEDFCQALGIAPEMKYQNEGGPALKQCFSLLREVSSAPVIDLQRFLDAIIFNFLIGNHDAHGKNFSILYGEKTSPSGSGRRLAPLYDLVCTVYYPELSQKMAMKIGGEYASDKVGPKHFEKLAEEAGLAKPMVKQRVLELAEAVIEHLPKVSLDHPVVQAVAQLIKARCEKVMRSF